MDGKTINGLLFLALVLVGILLLSGKATLHDIIPDGLTKSALRWRLAWMSLGAAIAFVFSWGKKLPADKALFGAIVCGILAYFLF